MAPVVSKTIRAAVLTLALTAMAAQVQFAQADESAGYAAKIRLYELDARYYESLLYGRVPGVTFKLKNEGTRTATRVEVTVYFKDSLGNIITEETYTPVSVDRWFENNTPLKPGYIWQIEAGKFYTAKSVPSEWAEGAVAAEISAVELAE